MALTVCRKYTVNTVFLNSEAMGNDIDVCHFERLPKELILWICSFFDCFRDTASLSLTNKTFYTVIWYGEPYNQLRNICLTNTSLRSRVSVMLNILKKNEFPLEITKLCNSYPNYISQVQQLFYPTINLNHFIKFALEFESVTTLGKMLELKNEFFKNMDRNYVLKLFIHACEQKKLDSLKWIVKNHKIFIRAAVVDMDWLDRACCSGNSHAIEYVIEQLSEMKNSMTNDDIQTHFTQACANDDNNPEAISTFIKFFPNVDLKLDDYHCFTYPVYWGKDRCAVAILSKIPNAISSISHDNFSELLFKACYEFYPKTIRLLVDNLPSNFDIHAENSDWPGEGPPFMTICSSDVIGYGVHLIETNRKEQYELLKYMLDKFPNIRDQPYYIECLYIMCQHTMMTYNGEKSIKLLISRAPRNTLRMHAWAILEILSQNYENIELTKIVTLYFEKEGIFALSHNDPRRTELIKRYIVGSCLKPNIRFVEAMLQLYPSIFIRTINKELLIKVCERECLEVVEWIRIKFDSLLRENIFEIFMNMCKKNLPKISIFLYDKYRGILGEIINLPALCLYLCGRKSYKTISVLMNIRCKINQDDLNNILKKIISQISILTEDALDIIYTLINQYGCTLDQITIDLLLKLMQSYQFKYRYKNDNC